MDLLRRELALMMHTHPFIFDLVMDAGPEGWWYLDVSSWGRVFLHRSFVEGMGYEAKVEANYQFQIWQQILPVTRMKLLIVDALEYINETGKCYFTSLTFHKADGTKVVRRKAIAAIRNKEGAIKRLLGIPADFLLQEKQTLPASFQLPDFEDSILPAIALTRRERRFQLLLEQGFDICILVDEQAKTIYQNANTERIMGYTLEERNLISPFDRLHPDDVAEGKALFQNVLNNPGKIFVCNYRVFHKNKSVICLHGTVTNLLDDPDIGAIVINVRDVTAIKEATAQLISSEQKWQALVERSKDVFVITQPAGVLYVSPNIHTILGYTPDEFKAIPPEVMVHPDDQPLRWHELKEPGSSLILDFRFRHKDGSWRWFEGHGVNLMNDPNIGALLFNLREITERKQFEFAITAQNRSLQLKNEELEQFAYIASHDLQEPLRSLSSFSSLLMRKCAGVLDEQSTQYLDFIQSSSERMKMLVADLLEYARIGKESRLEATETAAILKAVLDDLHVAISESGAEITVGDLPTLVCYPTELRLLLQNLISNALKFVQPNRKPAIHIEAKKTERHYQFSVADNGIGIPSQFREKIFLIFKRLHQRNEFEGSGIGLAHCKKVAEMHHGEIWFESILGEGTTFYFTIAADMQASRELD